MSSNLVSFRSDLLPIETFEEWVETYLEALLETVGDLRAEVISLRSRVKRLEQSAGRGLLHPSDVLEPIE